MPGCPPDGHLLARQQFVCSRSQLPRHSSKKLTGGRLCWTLRPHVISGSWPSRYVAAWWP